MSDFSRKPLETGTMADFLLWSSCFVLVMVALGLLRILHGPGRADRMMAAQLLGTGGIAALVLMAAASDATALVDVALVLALLAAFASVAFVIGGSRADTRSRVPAERA
jgi:multicomponent Na+:H+ antiporter subunit F